MVKLFCAIVNDAGAAFPVDIDAEATVGDLKNAIKKKNPATLACDAKDLELFLAKKDEGRGPWLTEAELLDGVADTSGFEKLDVAGAPLKLIGLSKRDVRLHVTKQLVKAKKTPVHVLVNGVQNSATKSSALEDLVKEVHAETLTKKRTFRHSQVVSSDCETITNELNIKITTVDVTGCIVT
ncbi:hypothetical protein CCR75_009260 [Bremia lactucae]|uniref:Crinkler effector protein N-terminal domain-containing protein n=1 Tax=Bremia lactucae TaxID=4779 RepID=A0A976FHP6_BRELC|nr:hypothetical protein CCR75_009260 [Bremia lactucae]